MTSPREGGEDTGDVLPHDHALVRMCHDGSEVTISMTDVERLVREGAIEVIRNNVRADEGMRLLFVAIQPDEEQ